MAREIPVSEFKASCIALLDEVASTGETIVVTKRGRALARVKPIEDPPPLVGGVPAQIEPIEEPPPLLGSVSVRVSDEELIAPLDDTWTVRRFDPRGTVWN